MKRLLALFSLVLAIAFAAAAGHWTPPPPALPQSNNLVLSEVISPDGPPEAMVFLFSGAAGWSADDSLLARNMAANGALVAGIDLPASFAKTTAANEDCVYFLGDIEGLSKKLQKSASGGRYRDPVLAGRGLGGAMALALAAQTPDASASRTIAVDPEYGIPLNTALCTKATKRQTANGRWLYDLEDHPLGDPLVVIDTPAADRASLDHVDQLVSAGHVIERLSVGSGADRALFDGVLTALDLARKADIALLGDLPLAVLPAVAAHDTMAIVISGDGGWRDLDREIARSLAEKGVPTVGIDSLRYFWSQKDPTRIAADLRRIIDVYGKEWNVHHIALVGFSFGADVLPAAFNQLPSDIQGQVTVVSLLALSDTADFVFHVADWIGSDSGEGTPTMPDIRKMPPEKIQCFYGEEDKDSVCEKIQEPGIELIRTSGGHHFDGDYAALADKIFERINQAPGSVLPRP